MTDTYNQDMILASDVSVNRLERMIRSKEELLKTIDRKRSIRDSERAMWKADVKADITSLKVAIIVLKDNKTRLKMLEMGEEENA